MQNIQLITDEDELQGRDSHGIRVDGRLMVPIDFQLSFTATNIRMMYDLYGEADAHADTTDRHADPLTFDSKLMLRAEMDFGIDRETESLGAHNFMNTQTDQIAEIASLTMRSGGTWEEKTCIIEWFVFNNTPGLGITVVVPEAEFARTAEGIAQGWFDRLTLVIWDVPGIYCHADSRDSRRLIALAPKTADALNEGLDQEIAVAFGPVAGISISCTRSFKLHAPSKIGR